MEHDPVVHHWVAWPMPSSAGYVKNRTPAASREMKCTKVADPMKTQPKYASESQRSRFFFLLSLFIYTSASVCTAS